MKTAILTNLLFVAALAGATAFADGVRLINGHMPEEYIFDATTLPAYQQIQPVIAKAARVKADSGADLAAVINGFFKDKLWYLVPTKLKDCQVMVIDGNSVWIDSEQFGAMSLASQQVLLWHEIGQYLVSSAYASSFNDPLPLFTTQFPAAVGTMDGVAFEKFLHGFTFFGHYYVLPSAGEYAELTAEQLGEKLNDGGVDYLTLDHYEGNGTSLSCDDVKISWDAKKKALVIGGVKVDYSNSDTVTLAAAPKLDFADGLARYEVPLDSASKSFKAGQVSGSLSASFSAGTLIHFQVSEMKCASKKADGTCNWSEAANTTCYWEGSDN